MFLKFINRKEELHFFEEKYNKGGFHFIVLYGRRRIGKTELIKEFIKNKPAIYFLADKRGTASNIERLRKKVAEYYNEPEALFTTFEDIFAHIKNKKEPMVLAIDEFTYLIEKDDSIPSVFQIVIDEIISDSNIFLIISGSSVSLMEEGVLSSKSPLYGRRTGQFKIEPLPLRESSLFFPAYDFKTMITAFSITGGVPFYLNKFDDHDSPEKNIEKNVLRKGEVLYEEVDFILKEELRDPSTYKSLFEAIASGCSKAGEITDKARMNKTDFDRYIKTLMNLGYLEKINPVTMKHKSKKTLYRIKDQFFNFWFTFCYPEISDLEIGNIGKIMQKIRTNLNAFVGKTFEFICKEFILKSAFFHFTKIGEWWGFYRDSEGKRKEIEIDICAIHEKEKTILFAECKWTENINAKKIVEELKEKSKYVEWNNKDRKEYYAVFAKSFKEKFKEKNVFLFDLKDMEKL